MLNYAVRNAAVLNSVLLAQSKTNIAEIDELSGGTLPIHKCSSSEGPKSQCCHCATASSHGGPIHPFNAIHWKFVRCQMQIDIFKKSFVERKFLCLKTSNSKRVGTGVVVCETWNGSGMDAIGLLK